MPFLHLHQRRKQHDQLCIRRDDIPRAAHAPASRRRRTHSSPADERSGRTGAHDADVIVVIVIILRSFAPRATGYAHAGDARGRITGKEGAIPRVSEAEEAASHLEVGEHSLGCILLGGIFVIFVRDALASQVLNPADGQCDVLVRGVEFEVLVTDHGLVEEQVVDRFGLGFAHRGLVGNGLFAGEAVGGRHFPKSTIYFVFA
mmetsp:Transcript_28000/g.51149  ORF Transcript_28000/g.51149 Transcript_28000/m.51149 type:complete len:203 (-) Transcript_28000:196-804(-)